MHSPAAAFIHPPKPMDMDMDALQLHLQQQQQQHHELASGDGGGDSYSYRWLLHIKPAADADHQHPNSSSSASLNVDIQPNYSPQLQRIEGSDSASVNFNFSSTDHEDQPSPTLLHADQLFSNGLLMPIQILSPLLPPPSNANITSTNTNIINIPPSHLQFSANSEHLFLTHHLSNPVQPPPQSSELIKSCCRRQWRRRWRWSSKRIFHKYLGFFLRPLHGKLIRRLSPIPPPMVNCAESLQATPRASITVDSATHSCHAHTTHTNFLFHSHVDNLIYEAILHCKNSNGQ